MVNKRRENRIEDEWNNLSMELLLSHYGTSECVIRKQTFRFPTYSDTNQAVQLQQIARGLKFRIEKEEGMYYLCSENIGADQLRRYREADYPRSLSASLFPHMQNFGFLMMRLKILMQSRHEKSFLMPIRLTMTVISLFIAMY